MNGKTQYTLNERKLMSRATLEVTVRVKKDWRTKVGLWLIRMGATIVGFGRVNLNAHPEEK